MLQVFAMRDKDSERPHFYLCWQNPSRAPHYASWFHMDEATGMISMNKTLEWDDFGSVCELHFHTVGCPNKLDKGNS